MSAPGAALPGRARRGRPRYLLVGGSNCILRNGFGAKLQQQVAGRWRNESLGGSSSLRGAEFLLRNPELVERWDAILFEYTLNDLIFEADRTLEPMTHLGVLRALAARPAIRERLCFVLMRGRHGRLGRERESFVIDHYRRVAAESGVRSIDLLEAVHTLEDADAGATFADADHFTPRAARALAAEAARQLEQLPEFSSATAEPDNTSPELVAVDPLTQAAPGSSFTEATFRTSLVRARMVTLESGSRLVVRSPGGLMAGFYALAGSDSGWLRISHRGHEVLKNLRHEGKAGKTFLALRHLSAPLHTEPGDEIVLRHTRDPYRFAHGTIDASRNQPMGKGGAAVSIGRIMFLKHRR